jgi:hypothetical protein
MLALAAPALLLACTQQERPPEPVPTSITATATPSVSVTPTSSPSAAASALAIEGEGLRLFDPQTGSGRPLPFGTDWAFVIRALASRGVPETGVNAECGAGPLGYARWPDSLTLYGQDGKFVGWFADTGVKGRITTAAGIGPGSTHRDLVSAHEAEVFESTLGTEFAAGDLFGILEDTRPEAAVLAMWAGTSCNFR